MTKVSIIVAVYNEASSIQVLLRSVQGLKYPRENFELCIVDDGSTDGTAMRIRDWIKTNSDISVSFESLPKNVGRRLARERAARRARFEHLLITDARCELFPDTLEAVLKCNYEPLNGNPIFRQTDSVSRFLYLVRLRMYPTSFGEKFSDVFIDEANFDNISKGTTLFFIEKERFLRNQTLETGRNVNEDTAILARIVKEKKILKTSKVMCLYWPRYNFLEQIRHIFERGPRFVYYYYTTSSKYFWPINFSIALTIVFLFLLFSSHICVMAILILAGSVVFSLWIAQNVKDFLYGCIIFPFLALTFFVGVLKGLVLKLFHAY